jgi:hypothetical protein
VRSAPTALVTEYAKEMAPEKEMENATAIEAIVEKIAISVQKDFMNLLRMKTNFFVLSATCLARVLVLAQDHENVRIVRKGGLKRMMKDVLM